MLLARRLSQRRVVASSGVIPLRSYVLPSFLFALSTRSVHARGMMSRPGSRRLPYALGWPRDDVAAWLPRVSIDAAAVELSRRLGTAALGRLVAQAGRHISPQRRFPASLDELANIAISQLEEDRAAGREIFDRTALVLVATAVAVEASEAIIARAPSKEAIIARARTAWPELPLGPSPPPPPDVLPPPPLAPEQMRFQPPPAAAMSPPQPLPLSVVGARTHGRIESDENHDAQAKRVRAGEKEGIDTGSLDNSSDDEALHLADARRRSDEGGRESSARLREQHRQYMPGGHGALETHMHFEAATCGSAFEAPAEPSRAVPQPSEQRRMGRRAWDGKDLLGGDVPGSVMYVLEDDTEVGFYPKGCGSDGEPWCQSRPPTPALSVATYRMAL